MILGRISQDANSQNLTGCQVEAARNPGGFTF